MADYFSAYLYLGGRVQREDAPGLVRAVNEQGFDNVPEFKDVQELCAHVNAGRPLYQNEARWGRFEQVQDWLTAHRLPFKIWAEDYGWNPAGIEVYLPGQEPVYRCSNGDQEVLVPAHEVIRLSNAILCASVNGDREELRARQAELEDLCGTGDRLTLPPLEVTD